MDIMSLWPSATWGSITVSSVCDHLAFLVTHVSAVKVDEILRLERFENPFEKFLQLLVAF